jgi:hypothetical protein
MTDISLDDLIQKDKQKNKAARKSKVAVVLNRSYMNDHLTHIKKDISQPIEMINFNIIRKTNQEIALIDHLSSVESLEKITERE